MQGSPTKISFLLKYHILDFDNTRVGIGFSSAPSSHLEKDPKFFLIFKVEKWPYPVHRAEVSSANKKSLTTSHHVVIPDICHNHHNRWLCERFRCPK